MDTDFYFRLANGEIHVAPYDSGQYVMHVGKYRGWTLRDIPVDYLRWALKTSNMRTTAPCAITYTDISKTSS